MVTDSFSSQNDDNYLLNLIQKGNKHAESILIEKYAGLARYFSGIYYIPGQDAEDVIQEGMIGLMEAARNYNSSKNIPFRSFASVCISRKIISSLRRATKAKDILFISYSTQECNPAREYGHNPEEIVISNENVETIRNAIDKILSTHERRVLMCFLNDMKYNEIATMLKSNEKSVDNALSRSRRKLNTYLQG